MYKKCLFLVLFCTGYGSIMGMQRLKAATVFVVIKLKNAAVTVKDVVAMPVAHGAQQAAVVVKDTSCAVGRKAGEQFGCVRRRKISHVSKKDD